MSNDIKHFVMSRKSCYKYKIANIEVGTNNVT